MGRKAKTRPDISDEQVATFLNKYPDGATSATIAKFLGLPVAAFVAECYRLEKKIAAIGARYV